jgi:Protein of unknown function (DUF3223)
LAKYKVGDAVTDQERDFLVAALRLRGAKGLEKIGTGVHRIYIDTNSFGTYCFFLERTDGTTIDFSYIKCFKEHISQPTKPRQKIIGKESKCLGDEHTTKIEKQTLLPVTSSEIVQETKRNIEQRTGRVLQPTRWQKNYGIFHWRRTTHHRNIGKV